MKRPVIWTERALAYLLAQVEYIAGDNPDAADRVGDKIQMTCAALGDHATGRSSRIGDPFYEKSVIGLPYVVIYTIALVGDLESVVIVRVVHTARHWPPGRWPE